MLKPEAKMARGGVMASSTMRSSRRTAKNILASLASALTLAAALVLGFGFFLTLPTILASNEAIAADMNLPTEPPPISPDDLAHFNWMQYKFFRAPDGYTAGIWAILDPEVELPATVQIAVPEAADVFWFGPVPEGGVHPESPQFHDYHVYLDEEHDLKIYTVTLTDSHQLQIEHYFWGSAFLFPVSTLPNGDHSIRISYTPLHDVPALRLAAFLPEGSAVRDAENVDFLGVGPTGDPAFAVTIENAQGLQNYTAEIEYVPAETTARQNQFGIEGGILTTLATVVASLAIGIGTVYFMLRKRRAHQHDEE